MSFKAGWNGDTVRALVHELPLWAQALLVGAVVATALKWGI